MPYENWESTHKITSPFFPFRQHATAQPSYFPASPPFLHSQISLFLPPPPSSPFPFLRLAASRPLLPNNIQLCAPITRGNYTRGFSSLRIWVIPIKLFADFYQRILVDFLEKVEKDWVDVVRRYIDCDVCVGAAAGAHSGTSQSSV